MNESFICFSTFSLVYHNNFKYFSLLVLIFKLELNLYSQREAWSVKVFLATLIADLVADLSKNIIIHIS